MDMNENYFLKQRASDNPPELLCLNQRKTTSNPNKTFGAHIAVPGPTVPRSAKSSPAIKNTQ